MVRSRRPCVVLLIANIAEFRGTFDLIIWFPPEILIPSAVLIMVVFGVVTPLSVDTHDDPLFKPLTPTRAFQIIHKLSA